MSTAKRYIYYVSYSHGQDNSFGFGAVELFRPSPIRSFSDVQFIQSMIKDKEPGLKQVLILNWILMRVDIE